VISPLEFMQRLAALVPRPRLHLIRFHGALAPKAKLRALVVPRAPAKEQRAAEAAVVDRVRARAWVGRSPEFMRPSGSRQDVQTLCEQRAGTRRGGQAADAVVTATDRQWIKRTHPGHEIFQVSHETIYRSLPLSAYE